MPPETVAPKPVVRRSNGIRTRSEIVAVAERLFAERGYEATRLEDIATEVGIRRAAIFYHFGDKQEVYTAVLDSLLGDVASVLPPSGSAVERLEVALTGWIDYVARRPNVARLILREAAASQPGRLSPFVSAGNASVEWFRSVIEEGVDSGELDPRIEPYRFMSLMGAMTVFHFAAMPWLSSKTPVDPGSKAGLDKHKSDILLVIRSMLGVKDNGNKGDKGTKGRAGKA